ncbi:MAG: hypothetical protein QM784_35105 [Polyangiaceae bacterium]
MVRTRLPSRGERSAMLRIPIPGGFTDPTTIGRTTIEGVRVGSTSMSPNGKWAVLYTTVETEERVVVVDLDVFGLPATRNRSHESGFRCYVLDERRPGLRGPSEAGG